MAPGDLVRIDGTVSEYANDTQLGSVTSVQVCASGVALPAPVQLVLPETVDGELERYEGMRVAIAQDMVITQNYFLGQFGQMTLASADDAGVLRRLFQPTNQYAPLSDAALDLADENARRMLFLDDGSSQWYPSVVPYLGAAPDHIVLRAGDLVSGLVGVLDEGWINTGDATDYRLQPTGAPIFLAGNDRTEAPAPVGGSLRVASFNVLNYFNGDGLGGGFPTSRGASSVSELDRQSAKIVDALLAIDADLVGLMEIENDGYGPSSAIAELVGRLNAVAGPGTYRFVDPGVSRIGDDEIAVGFIYRPQTVSVMGSAVLDDSVDPRTIETKNRPALAVAIEETATGEHVTVVVNHFKSKGSDCDDLGDPDLGDGQGNCNQTRISIAEALVDWLRTDPAGAGDPDAVIIGDLNAYGQEDPIQVLKLGGYTSLIETFGGDTGYSYVFDGQSGYLDHALAGATLLDQVSGTTEWHINTDEPRVIDYNEEDNSAAYYDPDPYRSSDHDPVVIGLALSTPPSLPGDLDGDGSVTFADRGLLFAAFRTGEGDPDYRADADLDGDGRVDGRDFGVWYRLWVAAGRRH